MEEIIQRQDAAIDMIATGGPQQTSRDEAVADTFARRIAFTKEAKQRL
jgi:hypothetical protein